MQVKKIEIYHRAVPPDKFHRAALTGSKSISLRKKDYEIDLLFMQIDVMINVSDLCEMTRA